jgi:hypothetical protein
MVGANETASAPYLSLPAFKLGVSRSSESLLGGVMVGRMGGVRPLNRDLPGGP